MLSKRRRDLPTHPFSLLHEYLTLADVNMRHNIPEAFDNYKDAVKMFAYVPDCYLARARAFIELAERKKKSSPSLEDKKVIDIKFIGSHLAALHNCYLAIELTPQNLTAHKLRAKILMTIQKPIYETVVAKLMAQHLQTMEKKKIYLQKMQETNKNLQQNEKVSPSSIMEEICRISDEYKIDLQVYNAITKSAISETLVFIKGLRNEIQKFSQWHQRILHDIHLQSADATKIKLLLMSAAKKNQIEAVIGYTDEIAGDAMLALAAYKKGELGIANYYFELAHHKFPSDILSMTYLADISLRNEIRKNQSLAEKHISIIKSTEQFNFSLLHALNAFAYAHIKDYTNAATSYIRAFNRYSSEHLDYFNSMQAEIYESLNKAGKLIFTLTKSKEFPDTIPKSTRLVQNYEDAAEQCFDNGNYQDALLYYSLAIWHEDEKRQEQNAKLEHLYRMRGHIFLLEENTVEANKNLDYAKECSSSPDQFYINSAVDAIERLADKTRPEKEKVPSHISPGFNEYIAGIRAFEIFNKTKFKQIALVILTNLIDNFPEFPDAYFHRARIYQEIELLQDAFLDLAVGVGLCPFNFDLLKSYIEIGRLLNHNNLKDVKITQALATNKLKEFNKFFRRSLASYKAKPISAEFDIACIAQTFLGVESFEHDNHDLANYLFTKSLLINKENFIAQTYRGFANLFGEPSASGAALEDFNYCIEKFQYGRAYYGRALLHARAMDFKEAANDFLRAYVNRTKDDLDFYNTIAHPIKKIFARVDETPDQLKSTTLVDFMDMGLKELARNLPETAKFHFSVALMIGDPKFLHTYYLLISGTNIQLGLPEEAKADIENSIKIATHKKIPNEDITILSSTFSQKCYDAVSSTLQKPSSLVAMQLCHLGLTIYPTQQLYLQRARLYATDGKYIDAKKDLAAATLLAVIQNTAVDPLVSAMLAEIEFKINPPKAKPSNQFSKNKKRPTKPKQSAKLQHMTESVKPEEKTVEAVATPEAVIVETVPTETAVAETEVPKHKITTASPASHITRNNRQKKRRGKIRANYKSNPHIQENHEEDNNVSENNDNVEITAETSKQKPASEVTIEIPAQLESKAPAIKVETPKPISYADIIKRTITLPSCGTNTVETSQSVTADETVESNDEEIIAPVIIENLAIETLATETLASAPVVEINTESTVERPAKVEETVEDATAPVIETISAADIVTIVTQSDEIELAPTESASAIVDAETLTTTQEKTIAPVADRQPEMSSLVDFTAALNLSLADIPGPSQLESQNSAIATTVHDSDPASSPRSTLHGSDNSESDNDINSPAPSPSPLNSGQNSNEPSPFFAGTMPRASSTIQLPTLEEFVTSIRSSSTPLRPYQQSSPTAMHSVFFRQPELPINNIRLDAFIPDYIYLYDIEHAFFKAVSEYERETNLNIQEPQDHVQFKTFINGGSVYDRILKAYKEGLVEKLPKLNPVLQNKLTAYLQKRMFNRNLVVDDIDIITELPREIVLLITSKLGFKYIVPTWAANQTQNLQGTYSPNIDCLSFSYLDEKTNTTIKIDIVCKPKIIFNHEAAIRTSRFFVDGTGRKIDLGGCGVYDLIRGQMRISCGPTKDYLIEPLKLMHLIGQTTKRKLKIFEDDILKTRPYDTLPIGHTYINSGLQKLFCKGSVITNYYTLHQYGFFNAILGPAINDYLIKDYHWIYINLQQSNEQTYPSLRHLYCMFIASIAMQFVTLQEQEKIAQFRTFHATSPEPVLFDALESYNMATSEDALLKVCEDIIRNIPLFDIYLGDGVASKPYVWLLKKFINERKASALPLPTLTYQNDIMQTPAEPVQQHQSYRYRR